MTESASAAASTCPWCSADVPAGRVTCPACGANLVETGESTVPGLTAIDAEAVLRNVRATTAPPRRSRILSLITGEEPDETITLAGSPAALAPPPPDVRREMLRMEIAAELSNLEAEADAIAADDAIENAGGTARPAAAEGEPAAAVSGTPVAEAASTPTDATPTDATPTEPAATEPASTEPA